MLTATERRNLQTPLIRSEYDGFAYHMFVTTPWFSPILIGCMVIEEGREGGSCVRFDEPDKLRLRVENGEATYQLVEHDDLNHWWEARLIESWMDPAVYAGWLNTQLSREEAP